MPLSFFFLIYFERERQRERETERENTSMEGVEKQGEKENPKQSLCHHCRAWCGAWSYEPWDHEPKSRVQHPTNWATHVPLVTLLFDRSFNNSLRVEALRLEGKELPSVSVRAWKDLKSFAILSVIPGSTGTSSESWSKMHNLRLHPDILKQQLAFNQITRSFAWAFKVENHCSRKSRKYGSTRSQWRADARNQVS